MLKSQANALRSLRSFAVIGAVLIGTLVTAHPVKAGSPATETFFGKDLPATGVTNEAQKNSKKDRKQINNPLPGGRAVPERDTFTQFNTYNNDGKWQPTTILSPAQQKAIQGGNVGPATGRYAYTSGTYSASTASGGSGGGFDCFSMLEMYATSASDIQANYAVANPWERLRMETTDTKTVTPNEQPEKFGGVTHAERLNTMCPPVWLPAGQCYAQEATPGSEMGTKGNDNFLKAVGDSMSINGFPFNQWNPTPLGMGGQDVATRISGEIAGDTKNSPEGAMRGAQIGQQAKMQNASDASAECGEHELAGVLDTIGSGLINVANEGTWSPCSSEQPTKTLGNAAWMVGQMYKNCYVYMAVLLLLPGAMITHCKSLVSYGFLSVGEDSEAQAISPFTAIMRSIIAIFLIPATQLIMSWCIDVGNSMQYEVSKLVSTQVVFEWAQEQLYNPPPENAANQMIPPSGGWMDIIGKAGKLQGVSDKKSQVETQSDADRMVTIMFNFMNVGLGAALIATSAFQICMICYLFLLGPIAAAFYAWPNGVGSLFNKVISNWIDGVVNVSLWRFWWWVIILCFYTRILWLMDIGAYDPNNQWEMAMFTSFQIMLVYIPFVPFEFKPGDMVDKVSEKAKEGSQQAISSGAQSNAGGQKQGGAHGGRKA